MSPRRIALLFAAWIALGISCQSSAEHQPGYDSWEEIMEHVMAPAFDDHLLPASELPPEQVGLVEVSTNAARAAGYLKVAMEIDPHSDVQGFAEIAEATENWLSAIADKARNGQVDVVQTLIRDGQQQYCDRCHDLLPH